MITFQQLQLLSNFIQNGSQKYQNYAFIIILDDSDEIPTTLTLSMKCEYIIIIRQKSFADRVSKIKITQHTVFQMPQRIKQRFLQH